jgi:transcriptional regulator PpsR
MSPNPADMADLGALAGLAPELASTFASIASDIALVIGPDGIIRNVALGDAPISRQARLWVGRPFIDTVTQDTRSKITQLLQDVSSTGVSRRREVNLPGAEGLDIPVAFAAIRLGPHGPVLAVGRDLRAIAAIQQRFLDAQQELERDYWQQRQAESRYRLLFQVATDAVLVVDAATLCIVEANRAAVELFGRAADQLVGQSATAGIDALSRPAVDELLITARASGKPAEIRARLGRQGPSAEPSAVDVAATPFRATVDGSSQMLLLVRCRRAEARGGDTAQRLAEFVEQTSDAVVITDSSGRVLMANPAFLVLGAPGMTETQVKGRALAELLGDPGHRLAALVAEVRRSGIATQVRAPIGGSTATRPVGGVQEVEVSAALLAEGDQECLGFILRRQGHHELPLQPVDGLVAAIENLAHQLGRVSLPELMQEATHLAERHLILSALQHAHGQTAAAATWLGITPESLDLRLQRHGLTAPSALPMLLN